MKFDVQKLHRIRFSDGEEANQVEALVQKSFVLLQDALKTKPLPCIDENDEPQIRYAKAEEFMSMGGEEGEDFLRFKHCDTRCYIYFYPNTGRIDWCYNRANFTDWDNPNDYIK